MLTKKEVSALQERVAELEDRLRLETAAHETDIQELTRLRERIELEERSFRELRGACEQKLAALDAQSEAYRRKVRAVALKLREKKERQDAQLKEEARIARDALAKEIADERERAHEQTLARIQAFGENYNYYLSQLKLMMDMLTRAALNTGAVFLAPEEADTDRLFREEIGKAPLRAQGGTAQDGSVCAAPAEKPAADTLAN